MTHQRRFRGSLTALVTPFRDGALDEEAFRAHVELADRERDARARPRGHDRRKSDAVA